MNVEIPDPDDPMLIDRDVYSRIKIVMMSPTYMDRAVPFERAQKKIYETETWIVLQEWYRWRNNDIREWWIRQLVRIEDGVVIPDDDPMPPC